ncbi:MAG TPA: potassium-transporting ATPase subunit KdpA [candidate division Zixibacteria bacterium]|nr:potassium-transporting ATPase subunit KdpA [candidate division Zixibacteria bacterium]
MSSNEIIQVILFIGVLIALTPILGTYLAQVFSGKSHILLNTFGWVERGIYRICKIDPGEEMTWKHYAGALLAFNVLGLLAVFFLQIFQAKLPLNPQGLAGVSWHSSLNTAISFMSNTNWQGYAGEAIMSYLTQMLGLCVQNFLSAATGIAVFLALARGIIRKSSGFIGNFWTDIVRTTLYILVPLSIILALALIGQGVVQTFSQYKEATTIEGVKQIIPLGPAASQIAIKQLGTNGGGFFNANSAHPYENPTPFSNFLEMLSILLIPAALVYAYGKMVGNKLHARVIFTVMLLMWLAGLSLSLYSEYRGNSPYRGISMEGKETRFGVTNSVIWSTATTVASNGSVNAMHDSLTPIAGGVAMFNIMLGEIIFGGVGAGMYGMLLFILLTVFLAGLMVGRTPEYLGKKIEAKEMQMTLLAILAQCAAILVGAGIALVIPVGLSSLANKGPHGLSEILYAYTSAVGNNGSAFAGLNANTVFYNLTLGFAMLIGRFAVIIPALVIAGNLAGKKITPVSAGTFDTNNAMFAVLLVSVILIVGALTFFPALTLGPIVEHFLMNAGKVF